MDQSLQWATSGVTSQSGEQVLRVLSASSTWDTVSSWLIGTPGKILLIAVGAFVTRFVLHRIIDKLTQRAINSAKHERLGEARRAERTQDLSDILMSQRRQQRAEAISSLLRSIVTISVYGIALLMIMQELGLDIAPLLASAGVVGVALGFGAQSLIKDYLSGIFMVLEDQYGVGDVVDLGPAIGTVEDVQLRITRVRDLTGVVWYVRNGEILRVGNKSQGWTLASVDVPIAYDEDLERVRAVVEAVAEDMDSDPAYDDELLGKPQYAGVESVSGDAMFIRIIAKAAPARQVQVTRAIRERLKLAFDRAGIRVPVLVRGNAGQGVHPGAAVPTAPAPSEPGGGQAGSGKTSGSGGEYGVPNP